MQVRLGPHQGVQLLLQGRTPDTHPHPEKDLAAAHILQRHVLTGPGQGQQHRLGMGHQAFALAAQLDIVAIADEQ